MLEIANSVVVFRGNDGEPLIRKTPGVCGGDACIRDTRIMVWLLIGYLNQGMADSELLAVYPELSIHDLQSAREYYRDHRQEIEEAIRLNEQGKDE